MQRPFAAYEGNDSYTFVCYCHDDAARVYPEIKRLHEAGLNIWYDEGVSPGTEWSESLASHIQRCTVFLYFITPRSVEREQCRQELNFALNQGRRILAVHLEQTQLPPALQLILSHRQAILKYEHPRRAYDEKLARALAGAADESGPSSPVGGQTTGSSSGLRSVLKFGAPAFALLLAVGTTWWFRGSELDEPTIQAPVMSDISERTTLNRRPAT